MKDNIFKTFSNEQIAQIIYDEFVKDNSLIKLVPDSL